MSTSPDLSLPFSSAGLRLYLPAVYGVFYVQPASITICADDNSNILHVRFLLEACYPNIILALLWSAIIVDTVHL